MILFSVLIPAIPNRIDRMKALFNNLQAQVTDANFENEVEILCFLDNKKRSVGHKRDGLVQLARGKYLSFVDDDDVIYCNYISTIVRAIKAAPSDTDVIVYDQDATINNGGVFKVHFGLEYANEQAHQKLEKWVDITRKPFHTCTWRTELAKTERFSDVSYGEDWDWCRRLVAKTSLSKQVRIKETLLKYVFDDKITEASTENAIIHTS